MHTTERSSITEPSCSPSDQLSDVHDGDTQYTSRTQSLTSSSSIQSGLLEILLTGCLRFGIFLAEREGACVHIKPGSPMPGRLVTRSARWYLKAANSANGRSEAMRSAYTLRRLYVYNVHRGPPRPRRRHQPTKSYLHNEYLAS
jgi:hypothetical protein